MALSTMFKFTDVGIDLQKSLQSPKVLAEFQDLTLLVLLAGHQNAGYVNNIIEEELGNNLERELLASVDSDLIYDYSKHRPKAGFVGDHFASLYFPEMMLYLAYDQAQQPFLMLIGYEPDLQWKTLGQALAELLAEFQIQRTVIVHSLPLPVPHTRPVGVTVHGTALDLLPGLSTFTPLADLSASFSIFLEYCLTVQEEQVLGLSLHIPHYVSEMPYPQGAVAAIEFVSAATGLSLPSDNLRELGRDLDSELAEQVHENQDVREMVTKMEAAFDLACEEKTPRSLLVDENEEIPDAEQIARSLQKFLATQPRHSQNGPGDEDRSED